MKKLFGLMTAAVLFAASAVPVDAKEFGRIGNLHVYFDVKPMAGVGATLDHGSGDRWTVHAAAGATLFALDRHGDIGVLGPGIGFDFYDFQHHDGRLRDLSRLTAGGEFGGGTTLAVVPTLVVARVGPLTWHYSFSRGVETFGVKRGRAHFFTFDVLAAVRMYNRE